MICIVQRVLSASVSVDGTVVGDCGRGLMLLVGVARGDEERDAELLADKICKMRVFEDAEGKMNRSLLDVGGGALVIPNFTLLASYRRGNRPDFFGSEEPGRAKELYDFFCARIETLLPHVGRGVFGAHMEVSLVNDGPLTIPMDSAVLRAPKSAF